MKNLNLLIAAILMLASISLTAQVAISTDGSDPDGSAMLDVKSTDKGILIPRMTLAQRNAISNPVTGLMIYQTDNTPGFYYYNGTAWVVVGNGATSINSLYDGASDGSSVFLGNSTGANDDGTSNQNLGYGINALNANTSGYENTAIGIEALKLVDGGHHNTALGIHALSANITGSNNTALGTNAGLSNTTGSGNIFIGANAAYNELGSNKLYIHNSTSATPLIYGEFDNDLLRINGTLDINNAYQFPTAAGTNGQILKTDGSGNLSWADDTNTGATNIDGLSDGLSDGNSLYMGAEAGNLAGSNKFSTGVGVWSLKDVTSGANNTALGTSSLMSLTEGSNNTVVGTNALQSITSASSNTVLGTNAGQSVTGSGNIFIGNEAAKTQTNISNKLFIDNSSTNAPLIYGDFEANSATINGTLNIEGATTINSEGSAPDESAILDLKSTDKGFLTPRMTEAQRNSIGSPAAGLVVWCTNCGSDGELQVYNGSAWTNMVGDAASAFFTCGTSEFVDIRNNTSYSTVQIGDQCWMAENLNYETANSWWHNNDILNGNVYGRLYTWEAALTACPSGWSLPSDDEWKTLEMALGMTQDEADGTWWRGTDEGGKMKETGTTHWVSPNTGATNSSEFSALPGGHRWYVDGLFYGLGEDGNWWSSSEDSSGTHAWYRYLYYDNVQVFRSISDKTIGYSVRCLKN